MLNGSQYSEFSQDSTAVLPLKLVTSTEMGPSQIGMFGTSTVITGGKRRRGGNSKKKRFMKGGGHQLEYSDYSNSVPTNTSEQIFQPLLEMPNPSLSRGGKRNKTINKVLRLMKSKKNKIIIGGMIPLSPAEIQQTDIQPVINSIPIVSTPIVTDSNIGVSSTSGFNIFGGKRRRNKKFMNGGDAGLSPAEFRPDNTSFTTEPQLSIGSIVPLPSFSMMG
jgi:hypothetical protein